MNTLEWTTRALRQARKLPPAEQRKIAEAVDTLCDWPRVEQVKAMAGKTG
jgi:mRNA-degrading endonuclease RelE of RelBE toxin-antitoxin system